MVDAAEERTLQQRMALDIPVNAMRGGIFVCTLTHDIEVTVLIGATDFHGVQIHIKGDGLLGDFFQ